MYQLYKHTANDEWLIYQEDAQCTQDLSCYAMVGKATSLEYIKTFIAVIGITMPTANPATLKRVFERQKRTIVHQNFI